MIWITGLSRAGKSTVAAELRELFHSRGVQAIVLDGDRLRGTLPWHIGYTADDRRSMGEFYSRLSRELAAQGHVVICATISLFRRVHAWNRRNIANYHEVWLRVPLDILRTRDERGLYAGSRTGASYVVGLDLSPEFPESPDLVIDNFGITPRAAADQVMRSLDRRMAHDRRPSRRFRATA